MGVNNLPRTVTRQRRDFDLNPGPSAPESSTLTTRLPSIVPIMDRGHKNIHSTTKRYPCCLPATIPHVSSLHLAYVLHRLIAYIPGVAPPHGIVRNKDAAVECSYRTSAAASCSATVVNPRAPAARYSIAIRGNINNRRTGTVFTVRTVGFG